MYVCLCYIYLRNQRDRDEVNENKTKIDNVNAFLLRANVCAVNRVNFTVFFDARTNFLVHLNGLWC